VGFEGVRLGGGRNANQESLSQLLRRKTKLEESPAEASPLVGVPGEEERKAGLVNKNLGWKRGTRKTPAGVLEKGRPEVAPRKRAEETTK